MGWSLSSPAPDYQGGKILFGVGYAELEIEPVGSSDHYFSIRVPGPSDTGLPHQVEFFIAERDHDVRASSFPHVISTFNIPLTKLVSQPYWSGLGLRRPHPNWEFISDKRD